MPESLCENVVCKIEAILLKIIDYFSCKKMYLRKCRWQNGGHFISGPVGNSSRPGRTWTATEIYSIGYIFLHYLHRKWSFWRLPMQPMNIFLKWHLRFSVCSSQNCASNVFVGWMFFVYFVLFVSFNNHWDYWNTDNWPSLEVTVISDLR